LPVRIMTLCFVRASLIRSRQSVSWGDMIEMTFGLTWDNGVQSKFSVGYLS
jgi:hypothetical protein